MFHCRIVRGGLDVLSLGFFLLFFVFFGVVCVVSCVGVCVEGAFTVSVCVFLILSCAVVRSCCCLFLTWLVFAGLGVYVGDVYVFCVVGVLFVGIPVGVACFVCVFAAGRYGSIMCDCGCDVGCLGGLFVALVIVFVVDVCRLARRNAGEVKYLGFVPNVFVSLFHVVFVSNAACVCMLVREIACCMFSCKSGEMSCIVEVLMPLIIIVSCCLSLGVVFLGVFCVLFCLCVPGGCGGVVVCVVGWCWRGGSPVAIPPSCTSLSRCSCLFGLCV
jgi:hypothetical protein